MSGHPRPPCSGASEVRRNPYLTVDLIIRCQDEIGTEGIILIERRNLPIGWALPGGFVDYGESLEDAARREALEETGLDLEGLRQFHAYSDPRRDPRQHNVTVVFLARAIAQPTAGDDARSCKVFPPGELPAPLAFDHEKILRDYDRYRRSRRCPR